MNEDIEQYNAYQDFRVKRTKELFRFKPINKALSHKEYIHKFDSEHDQRELNNAIKMQEIYARKLKKAFFDY